MATSHVNFYSNMMKRSLLSCLRDCFEKLNNLLVSAFVYYVHLYYVFMRLNKPAE